MTQGPISNSTLLLMSTLLAKLQHIPKNHSVSVSPEIKVWKLMNNSRISLLLFPFLSFSFSLKSLLFFSWLVCWSSCRRDRLASGPGEMPSSFNGKALNICVDYMDRGVERCSELSWGSGFIRFAVENGRQRCNRCTFGNNGVVSTVYPCDCYDLSSETLGTKD